MRSLPNEVAAHLAARKGLLVHALIWLQARDRVAGTVEGLGLWTGADHQLVTVGGVDRTYYGVGAVLGIDALVSQSQGNEQTWSFQVSSLHAQVVEALRVYDARLAPVELHSWYFDPLTHNPLTHPVREFRGTVMEVDLPTPPIGGEATATVTCVSDAWRLTRSLTLRRSQGALKARASGDGFRKHNTISGAVQVAWGEWLKEATPANTTTPSDIDIHMGGDR